MSETATRLLDSVLALPENERAAFRDALDESLREAPDADFDALIARRVQDIRDGKVKGVPVGELMDRLRKKYQK